jgi:hypothetical protein
MEGTDYTLHWLMYLLQITTVQWLMGENESTCTEVLRWAAERRSNDETNFLRRRKTHPDATVLITGNSPAAPTMKNDK